MTQKKKLPVKKLKREFEKDKNGKVIGIEVLYFSKISLEFKAIAKTIKHIKKYS